MIATMHSRGLRFPLPTFSDCDVSEIDPIWQPHEVSADDEERASKRRRIEDFARRYLVGDTLRIQSAALLGPFDKSWQNPWIADGSDFLQKENEKIPVEDKKEKSDESIETTSEQGPARQQVDPKPRTSSPKKKATPKSRKRKENRLPTIPALPLETGVESWLKRRPEQTVSHDDQSVSHTYHQSTPSRPSKIVSARSTRSNMPKARRKRQTRQTTKAQQAQLPLTNLSKASNQSVSKNTFITDEPDLPNQIVEANKSLVVAAKPVPVENRTNSILSSEIHKSLARIRDNLEQPETKDTQGRQHITTLNSSHSISSLPPKRGNETNRASKVKPGNGSSDEPILDTPILVDCNEPADAPERQDHTTIVPAEPTIKRSIVETIAEAALAQMENAHESTAKHLSRPSSPLHATEDLLVGHQRSRSDETTTTATLMNESNPKPIEQLSKEKTTQATAISSTNALLVPSFPEHQDSKAYSPPTIDLNTQAALFQAQGAFQADFSLESPFKSQPPSPTFTRHRLPQTGSTVAPFRALRKSRHRPSIPRLGSTQDLLAAAQGAAFSAGKKDTTTAKKRASFADWPASKDNNHSTTPSGSDENRDPSLAVGTHAAAAAAHQQPPLKPSLSSSSQQPSSQPLRSCLKPPPLREDSSQGNSQPLPCEVQFPTVSFLPSVQYSAGDAVRGVPAASWQVGQGQGQSRDDVEGEMSLDLDLERSLDEAVEFLNVDYVM